VTDEAAAALRALLRHNPALPGRLVRLVTDEAGAVGVILVDAPNADDVELRPGLVAERGVADLLGGALLDYEAAGGRLVVRRGDGRAAPADPAGRPTRSSPRNARPRAGR
jgi:hypothetical protein